MSSPSFGFSPWRRRAESIDSQESQEHSQTRALSPSRGQDVKLSSSYSASAHREPIRSFIHGSFRDHLSPVNSAQYARTVREDTAELANYQLTDQKERRSSSFLARKRSHSIQTGRDTLSQDTDTEDVETVATRGSEPIPEVSEPSSPENIWEQVQDGGPSLLSNALRRTSPEDMDYGIPQHDGRSDEPARSYAESDSHQSPRITSQSSLEEVIESPSETTPLLRARSQESRQINGRQRQYDVESQKAPVKRHLLDYVRGKWQGASTKISSLYRTILDPKRWTRKAVWENAVVAPIACLPAVIVGLLLNILDALSYGMILFPLGSPIFANLGSAGISIFYVSTIISQLTFSMGSIFKGGIGSELIEVVPFFHSMAATITVIVGEDEPEAVIATTIVSYAISSMLTGLVFYLMGKFKFGYIVGFIPRHILIGCIGGVGWFLVATGFEVSARIDGSLEYDLATLHKLIQTDTIPLWLTPLCLAILLFWGQRRNISKYFLPLYIIAIPFVFYFFVLALDALDTDTLRDHGWIFEGPPANEPWWYFYTLYQFDKVHWGAIAECIPAMLALTFFGLLHVPINVPALALNTGEDQLDLDHELRLHGYSNFLSGVAGSIQNYLVYANTTFFMRSGGDSRLAGIELAVLTGGMMMVGPKIIGFIPIMMVGCLIFDLGFELLLEAVWQPRKKLKLPEYLTVIAIVLIMGIYDFVVGIGVGILLAFVSMIFQTSQVSAVRATYSGEIVNSTVRRNPSQQHYVQQVARQIYVIKLAGYLFFGTIVSVEEKIRALIADDVFDKKPIRYLVLDLRRVTGLDYSAGEAFNTISRLINGKGIQLVLSGVDAERSLGHDLRAVGLGEDGIDVTFLPDLNSALESCENELLKTLYARQETMDPKTTTTASLEVPDKGLVPASHDLLGSSPRQSHLQEAARVSINKMEVSRLSKWQNFKEPLRLMLQVFQDVSDKNEDFWFPATQYFVRREYKSGTKLFTAGETAQGFYLLEKGILRADYDVPHGQFYHESIVAGTTCGELPFFSETTRTATAYVELDCVVWMLDQEAWKRLQKEQSEIAHELLRVSLKLTAERMSTVPSSTMLMAE